MTNLTFKTSTFNCAKELKLNISSFQLLKENANRKQVKTFVFQAQDSSTVPSMVKNYVILNFFYEEVLNLEHINSLSI